MTPGPCRWATPTFGLRAVLVICVAAVLTSCGGNDSVPQTGPGTPPATTLPTAAPETTANPGVFDDRVLFGQSAAFSGPAARLGSAMKLGIEAAFYEANQRGGVHGRQLELMSLDDAYEPEDAVVNTTRLIEEEKVFALIGAVGTPTSRSATPVALEAGVPYIAPFTGAEFLRDKEVFLDNVVNVRASYYQETEEMVERLQKDLLIDRIAVMYQDDSFGRAGYRGVRRALERRGLEPVAVGLYPRNTTSVKTGLLDLRAGNPQAVVLIGAYKPVAELIAWARYTDMEAIFMTVSFVGSNALAEELGDDGEGVYVTQVVPFPTGRAVPIVDSYLRALSEYDSYLRALPEYTGSPDPGFVSLEGYLAGRLAIAGLQECGREVDRTCFIDSFRQSESIDIDGFQLQYGDRDNQGSESVFLTVIGEDGAYRPVESLSESGR